MKYLSILNVLYYFDKEDEANILLEHNKTINMGKDMEDSLENPIQLEDNGTRVDLRPKSFYQDK